METIEATSVLLQVGKPGDADGTVEKLHAGAVSLSDSAVMDVNKLNTDFTVGKLDNHDGTASVRGELTVDGAGGMYYGRYGDGMTGATLNIASGADQTLLARKGLIVKGSGGKVTLAYSVPTKQRQLIADSTGTIDLIETTGTDVVLDNAAEDGSIRTLTLANASSMRGGTLSFAVKAQDVYEGTAAAITTDNAFTLDGTEISISQVDTSYAEHATFDLAAPTQGLELFSLADSSAGSKDVAITLSGDFLTRYYRNARLRADGMVLADLVMDYYTGLLAETENGAAGLQLLDAASLQFAPQDAVNRAEHEDAANLLDVLDGYIRNGDTAAADKLGAAVAGASTATLGHAFAGDMERQLRAIRNRTTTMGVNQAVVNEDMPYFNAWINAEGDYRKVDADGSLPGYELTSWGGTVGFDVDCTDCVTAGLAFSALYGDLETDSADKAKGDMDTYYLSAFARATSGRWVHTFVGSLGRMSATLDRTVSYGTGSYRTQGETDGLGFGLMYEVGYTVPLDEDASVCLQPVANVTWRHVNTDAYEEEGSDASLAVGEQEYDALTFGLGARLQAVVGESIYNRTSILELRALLKLDAGDREGEAEVGFLGTHTKAKVNSAELGAVGAEVGLGLTIPIDSECSSIFVDLSADFRSGATNANAAAGYRVNF